MLRLRDLGLTPNPRTPRVAGVNQMNSAALDISEVPTVEVVLTISVHLMSAAAIACGLAEDGEGSQTPDPAGMGAWRGSDRPRLLSHFP